jgi:mRNA-degrading endonuclease toxin of MazEF toxin-antitoxin module
MVQHRTAIIVIKRDSARSSNGKRPRTVFTEDAEIGRSHVLNLFVVPATVRLASWPTEVALGPEVQCSKV